MDVATAALRVRVRLPGEGLIALADQSPGEPFESTRETLERRTHVYARTASAALRRTNRDAKRVTAYSKRRFVRVAVPTEIVVVHTARRRGFPRSVRSTDLCGYRGAALRYLLRAPEPAPPSLRFRVARRDADRGDAQSRNHRARLRRRDAPGGACHSCRRAQRLKHTTRFGSYGRGPNDGRVNGSSGSSGSAANEKATRARAYTFFVRAVRLLPAFESAHSMRGANGFSNDAGPLRLSHEVKENESHEKRASDLFLRPLGAGPGQDAAGETRRGVAIEPAKARDILLTAGPAEAFEDARPRDASDVASYATADAAELTALDRLTRVASASAASAAANPRAGPAPRVAANARAFESSQTPAGFETSRPADAAAAATSRWVGGDRSGNRAARIFGATHCGTLAATRLSRRARLGSGGS